MESPISLYYLNKFYEVQSDLTLTGHVYAATILLMNNDFYNELPEDLQKIVTEAAAEYSTEQRKIAQQQDKEFMDDLKELGMKIHEMNPDDREVFRQATESVYEKYTPIIGEELVEKAKAANQ